MKKPKVQKQLKYELVSAEERNQAAPTTFQIPDKCCRTGLKIGNSVKLMFADPEGQFGGERMWVKVTKILDSGQYEGTLDNDPVILNNVKFGDRIQFEAEHICDIEENQ